MRKPAAKVAPATPVPAAAPGRVWLRSEELGETREFDAAHAARLVARGSWQPVEGSPAAAASTD